MDLKYTSRAKRFAVTAIAFAVAAIFAGCATPSISIVTPDLAAVADGKHSGSWDGGIVKATVDVTVSKATITGITIVRHECGLGKKAEKIVGEVIRRQSLDVDTVSGATYSSKVILKAIEVALGAPASPRE